MSSTRAAPVSVVIGLVLGLTAPAAAEPTDYAGAAPVTPVTVSPTGGSDDAGTPPPPGPAVAPPGSDYAGLGAGYAGVGSDFVAGPGPRPAGLGAGPRGTVDTADVGGRPAGTAGFPVTTGDLAGLSVLTALVLATLVTLRRRST